jgi:hypothetical protein
MLGKKRSINHRGHEGTPRKFIGTKDFLGVIAGLSVLLSLAEIWPPAVNAVKLVVVTSRFISSGAVAQLGERVVRNDEATGSIPVSSTIRSAGSSPSTCRFQLTNSPKDAVPRELF